MRTLLFCTAYAQNIDVWNFRYKIWYEFYQSLELGEVQIYDDASSTRPDYLSEKEFVSFLERLGRQGLYSYPGWYRSFSSAIAFAYKNHFDKIIHVESDAYILSKELISFVREISSGWNVLWCPHHNLPESAIQIIGKDEIPSAYAFTRKPYSDYRGQCLDQILPYTSIHTRFVGDRYGEFSESIPLEADFSCQTSSSMIQNWIREKNCLTR